MKSMLTVFVVLFVSVLTRAGEPEIEVLIGYIRNQQGMIFQVYSGGCTEKEDFRTNLEERDGKTYLTLYRVNPDYCKALMPFGRYIQFSYDDLKISQRHPVQVLNPLNPGFIY